MSWITTDATPSIIGVVGWRERTYIRLDAEETMKEYAEADGLQAGIADKELMGLVLGSVAGFAAHPGDVLFIGVDNLNAVDWVIRGKSRGEFARGLLSTFLLWFVPWNCGDHMLLAYEPQCHLGRDNSTGG